MSCTLQQFTKTCSNGSITEAFSCFKSLIWSDPNLFTHMIKSCIAQNSLPLAKQLHALTITSGCFSDKFINNHLLNMYCKLSHFHTALHLFDVMPKKNFMTFNVLINGYVNAGDLMGASRVFDGMDGKCERNLATWNAMIAGFTQFGFNEDGVRVFEEMYRFGFLPDEFGIGSVLKGCAGLKGLSFGRMVHSYVVKSGFERDLVVGNALGFMYMKCGMLSYGERVIRMLPCRSVVAWNTLIAGKAQNGFYEEVMDMYCLMKISGYRPDKITFVSVVSSCSELAVLGQGRQIHAEIVKVGASSTTAVISSLISMYSRCGCLEDSVKAFGECGDADVVLWSSMIAAYGFHGRGKDAVRLFEQMEEENLEANDVTFLSLLYACSHCGLKEKGSELFELMLNKYGVKPRVEHYTCMVDLLGRSGRLEEAEAMIRSMPLKPDEVIWKTLLSACKIHKNADMAKRIAKEILKINPGDSASYVLLSNIHASAMRWQDVSEVRKAMRDRNVKKEPGISWLEFKNQVHQFSMADKSHPKYSEIDLYLKELTAEMKLRGYIPDTGSVLHDMDNEEKEYDLRHHSEKLAVAFALMNTIEGVPIRIMKNLRVCGDCHLALKFISEIKNREIIVRDASRFHHFKHGKCSCGDYW